MNPQDGAETPNHALTREALLLPGWEPSDPVPAIAIYPKNAEGLPCVFLFHGVHGRKEVLEPWAADLAKKGCFVLTIDQYFHGE